ncbi:MAG: DUF1289 domain-containing protein [Candidatus Dadabacteria bacterium]|nr:DUF1289 domain-containing protein [Candidatus Dadabacteria bacterium]MDE0663073.1 DUF1289 domain-containing protein [Candidatus Dadabacteria bacterium]
MGKTNSPCNGICIMDEDTGLCVGCLRTSDEIAGWEDYSDEQRAEVMREITQREAEQNQ